MSTSPSDPCLAASLRWLSTHAGFPARRLPDDAVGMICVAALAAAEEEARRLRAAEGARAAAAPAGVTHVTLESSTTLTPVAGLAPNATAVVPVRLVPVIVTVTVWVPLAGVPALSVAVTV